VTAAAQDEPLVSVIVAAREAAATLGGTLDSLAGQDFVGWEAVVVVDDGSVDATVEVARRHAGRDGRIRVRTQAGGGRSAARNAGTASSRGTWLLFIQPGDRLEPDALAGLLAATAVDPEADCVHGGWVWTAVDGAQLRRRCALAGPDLFDWAATRCPFPLAAGMVRRTAVVNAGGFDLALEAWGGWDLWQRLARGGARFSPAEGFWVHCPLRRAGDPAVVLTEGLEVIDRGHAPDRRIPDGPRAHRNGRPAEGRGGARAELACHAAGLAIGSGTSWTPMVDTMRTGPAAVDPDDAAAAIALGVVMAQGRTPAAWLELPEAVSRQIGGFVAALADATGAPALARQVRTRVDRLAVGALDAHPAPFSTGSAWVTDVRLDGVPEAVLPPTGIERVFARPVLGERRLAAVELPGLRLPREEIVDALVAAHAWELLGMILAPVIDALELRAEGGVTSIRRGATDVGVLPSGHAGDAAAVYDAAGWTVFLQSFGAFPTGRPTGSTTATTRPTRKPPSRRRSAARWRPRYRPTFRASLCRRGRWSSPSALAGSPWRCSSSRLAMERSVRRRSGPK
jgi:hypothetical protein